jgi:hypothetical protein
MKIFFRGSDLSLLSGLLGPAARFLTYDRNAYEKATGAKAEALSLMDKATGSFSSHEKEVEAVSLTIEKSVRVRSWPCFEQHNC